jgi:4-diphosphocytidyl-2-C-methyl-D-erythritol kinase
VSLYDRLTLELTADYGEIAIENDGSPHAPPGEANLCHRAARYFFARTGVKGGVRIRLEKSIPAGAGLGGGSSDAASVVLALETLTGSRLSEEDRRDAAFHVGADVPFFFARGPAWVEGIGERVTPVRFAEPLWLVLVHPGVFLSTAAVFSNVTKGLTTPDDIHTIMQFNFQGIAKGLRNDLELRACALEPVIGKAREALRGVGSDASLMTGSGSAVFGLFPDERRARLAAATLAASAPEHWRVEAVHTIDRDSAP